MANTPISPKVTAAGIAGIIASLLLSVVTLITPDLFAGLGNWSGPAYGLTIAVVTSVAGYLKADPLRDLGHSLTLPTVPDEPAPAAPITVAPAATFPAAKIDALPTEAPAPAAPVEVVPVVPVPPAA